MFIAVEHDEVDEAILTQNKESVKEMPINNDKIYEKLLSLENHLNAIDTSILWSKKAIEKTEEKILEKATDNGDGIDNLNSKHSKRALLINLLFLFLGLLIGVFSLVTFPYWSPYIGKIADLFNGLSKFIPFFNK